MGSDLVTREILTTQGVIFDVRWNTRDKSAGTMIFTNGKELGEVVQDVDGYYAFVFFSNGGLWTSHVIASIAITLNDLNKEWDDTVKAYFDSVKGSEADELDDVFIASD